MRLSAISVSVALIALLAIGAETSQGSTRALNWAGSVTNRPSGDFCGPRVARNFLAPISKMAPVEQIPRAGKLAFAPRGVRLVARGRLVVGSGWIGFTFSDEAGDHVRHLNWRVSARLHEVDARGEPRGRARLKRRFLSSVRLSDVKGFHFEVGGKPAFYRMDILVQSKNRNRQLGTFSRYFRVVKPRYAARLILSRPVVHRNESIKIRLGNYGTERLSSVAPTWRLAVERAEGDQWVPAAFSPSTAKHKAIISNLPPGRMAECARLHIPPSEVEGRYRVRVSVRRSAESPAERTAVVMAGFNVSGRELK